MVIGSLAAVTGFLAGGMFETNFYDSEVVMLLYFIMGAFSSPDKRKIFTIEITIMNRVSGITAVCSVLFEIARTYHLQTAQNSLEKLQAQTVLRSYGKP